MDAKKSLLGGMLCFSGLGSIAIWTNVNIYFFSYFYYQDNTISLKLFNTMISITALSGLVISLVSMKVAKKIGLSNVIKLSMILYPISMIIASFMTNVYLFTLFYSVFLGIASGLSMLPITSLLYGYFGEKNSGNVTGLLLGFFGIFTVFFILLTTLLINPNNDQAYIEYKEGIDVSLIFGYDVAKNVPRGILAQGLLCLFVSIPGACLVKDKAVNNNVEQIEENPSSYSVNGGFEESLLNNKENMLQEQQEQENQDKFSFIKYIKDRNFQIMILIAINVSMQVFFISLNFKQYGLEKLNDDHFLMITLVTSQIVGAFSKFLWGYMVDNISFKKVIAISLLIGGVLTVIFPLVASSKSLFLIVYMTVTICERGFLTIGPAILIRLYGVDDGTLLIPPYQIAFLLGLIIVPLLQILLFQITTFDVIFHVSGGLVLASVLLVPLIKTNEEKILLLNESEEKQLIIEKVSLKESTINEDLLNKHKIAIQF